MTTPFTSASYPSNPTVPSSAPAGYTTPTTPPSPDAVNPPVSAEQLNALRGNLLEMVLRQVAQALIGAFVPGAESAFNQLASWAANIPVIGPLITAITGIIDGDLNALANWSQNIPSNVVDNVALNPGKFFAEAANVTGLTALWVNTIQPFLAMEFGKSPIFSTVDGWVNGILGVTNNPTGNTGGSLVQAAASTVTDAASTAAANATSAIHSAITTALTAGSPSAATASDGVMSVVNALTSSNSATWNLPIPQSIAEMISNITFGCIQFWQAEPGQDWVHLFLGSPPNPPAGIPASWHQNLDGTPPPPPSTGSTGSSSAATDGTANLPIPSSLASILSTITGGYLSFWWADDGSWIHGAEPIGGQVWQDHHVDGPNGNNPITQAVMGPVTSAASNLLTHPAVSAVTSAVGNALSGGSPSATGSPVAAAALSLASTLTSNTSSAWNLPIPQAIAELISNITFGCIQFYQAEPGQDWVHLFIGNPPNPPPGIPASWHENLDGTPPPPPSTGGSSTPSGPDESTQNLPIPSALASFLSMITGGYLSFWWADDGSWVHGGEPIGGQVWQDHRAGPQGSKAVTSVVAPVVKNVASNVAAMAAPAVAAVASAANAAAPAKGITGEAFSVFENLMGLLSNPSGSSLGSIVSSAMGLLTSGALSGPDVVSNITSALTAALSDALAGKSWTADISSRFGNNDLATLLIDIVGILTNPNGSSDGSIPQSIWQTVWQFINCNGLTGKLFSAGQNVTGVFDNPTGVTIGALSGYVADLVKTLFANHGAGLQQLIALAQALVTGNICVLVGDFFNGTFATAQEVAKDVGGIINFFTNPSLPSPTDLANGAQTAAQAALGAAAGAIGLGNTAGGLANSVTQVATDFMGTLGNPNGLGSGNVILNELDKIPILGPILEHLFGNLGGTGSASSDGLASLLDSIPLIGPLIEQLPWLHAGSLGPGATASQLPDPSFSTQFGADIDGSGLWAWAWPGRNAGTAPGFDGNGCVRTVRPDVTTIYYVPGTWEILPGHPAILGFSSGGAIQSDPMTFLRALASATGDQEATPGTNILDWSKFELVVVPYGGATYPMGQTESQGVAMLTSLINARPGKFILIGHSQGGCVVSDVYDSIRTGALQSRDADLIMGVGVGNMRRQAGTSFPATGTNPAGQVYQPDGPGCFNPLNHVDGRWWEWAVPAGTYPASGSLTGVTYTVGDDIATLADTTVGQEIRALISSTMSSKSFNLFTAAEDIFKFLTSPGGKELLAALAGNSAHSLSAYKVQPFLAQGDTRTFWQIMLDAINHLNTAPVPAPTRHMLRSEPTTVQGGATVTIGAWTEWMNVTCTGPAIIVGLDCFDANNNLIATPSSFYDSSGNLIISMVSSLTTISSPATNSTAWQHLTDEFQVPANAVKVSLVFDVEPAAMTTGTVFFDDGDLKITSGTINAGQLGNIDNIPTVGNGNVFGHSGIATLEESTQHLLDGLATALGAEASTNTTFSQVFDLAAQLAATAAHALQVANTVAGTWGPLQQTWSTAGTTTYAIPSQMVSGDKFDIAVLAAGGGGSGFPSQNFLGGQPGEWNAVTLTYGTDIPLSTTHLTVVVGAGGPISSTGNAGASSVSGTGMTTITSAGGTNSGNTDQSGAGPGTHLFNGRTYPGGQTTAQNTGMAGAPGGGGCGGNWFNDNPSPGADGYVSIVAYRGS